MSGEWKQFISENKYFLMTNKTATIIENIVLFDVSVYA